RGGDRVRDPDDRLLGNPRVAAADRGKDRGADEREREAGPVDGARMRIAVRPGQQDRHRRAERGDLGEREVDEDDSPLDDVNAEIRVDAGDDQAGHERREQELQDVPAHGYLTPAVWNAATSVLTL